MAEIPTVVAFDVIETTFSIESLRPRLDAVGLSEATLELWFVSSLRDAFAMAATDTYSPFSNLLAQTLIALAKRQGGAITDAQAQAVVAGFAELEPHDDAQEAFAILRAAGVRIATLTNGSAETTQALMRRAGLVEFVERTISVDEVGAFKPDARVYRHAAAVLGVQTSSLVLVAAHAWDIHGAKCAGLAGAYVARGQTFPVGLRRPDVQGESLADVALRLTGKGSAI